MKNTNTDTVYQVRLADGSLYVPDDARPDDPRRAHIRSRFVAELFARDFGGTVEVAS